MDDDGWELDDWEDEAFDDGLWDASQADLDSATELDDPDDLDDVEELDELEGPTIQPGLSAGEASMGWSAWEVGTVFALGGWLADHHAEQVGQQVAEALRDTPSASTEARSATRRAAPHPPPPTDYPYEVMAARCQVGYPLEQNRLFVDLVAAVAWSQDRLVQAEGDTAAGGRLVLVASAVPTSAGPWLWVVAEEHPRGFSAARLVPVFQPDRDAGVAVFATDHAFEAADAAVWACQREGVTVDALTVTHRQ